MMPRPLYSLLFLTHEAQGISIKINKMTTQKIKREEIKRKRRVLYKTISKTSIEAKFFLNFTQNDQVNELQNMDAGRNNSIFYRYLPKRMLNKVYILSYLCFSLSLSKVYVILLHNFLFGNPTQLRFFLACGQSKTKRAHKLENVF